MNIINKILSYFKQKKEFNVPVKKNVFFLGNNKNSNQVWVSQDDLKKHIAVIGTTIKGKSSLDYEEEIKRKEMEKAEKLKQDFSNDFQVSLQNKKVKI